MLEEVQKEKKTVAFMTESYFAIREDLKRANISYKGHILTECNTSVKYCSVCAKKFDEKVQHAWKGVRCRCLTCENCFCK